MSGFSCASIALCVIVTQLRKKINFKATKKVSLTDNTLTIESPEYVAPAAKVMNKSRRKPKKDDDDEEEKNELEKENEKNNQNLTFPSKSRNMINKMIARIF